MAKSTVKRQVPAGRLLPSLRTRLEKKNVRSAFYRMRHQAAAVESSPKIHSVVISSELGSLVVVDATVV